MNAISTRPWRFSTPKQIPISVPDGISGDWRVETFTVSKEEADFANIRAMFRPLERIEPGTYKRLMNGRTVVMSNTPMEIDTNRDILREARGQVLINGLGLGMVLTFILAKPEVEHVTVVEKNADVIALVGPTFANERLTIVHADAFEYQPKKGVRFAAVWHDIWNFVCSDNLAEMAKLKRKYARRADWQGCWSHIECLRAQRRGY